MAFLQMGVGTNIVQDHWRECTSALHKESQGMHKCTGGFAVWTPGYALSSYAGAC